MEIFWVILPALFTLCNAEDILKILPVGNPEVRKPRNESFAFTCIANVPQLSDVKYVKWVDPKNNTIDENYLKNNQRYSQMKPQDNMWMLKIIRLSPEDAGEYKCQALYNDKEYTTSAVLIVQIPITFIDAPKQQMAKLGEKSFKLKCKVEANPSPTVYWSKNDVILKADDKYILQPDGLVISDVQESDDGSYSCEVTVSATGELSKHTINLEVISVPKVSPSLAETYNITEGETARIQCNATGKPRPTISWIKTSTRKNLTSDLDGILYIEKVTKDDDGEFKCVAINKAGYDEKSVRLLVQSKPEIMEVVNGTSVVGRSGQIDCYVYGNPQPNVTIRKFGFHSQDLNIETNEVRTISEKVRTTLEKIPDPKKRYNGKAVLVSLKFNNTERSDDGLYQCVANNKVGETIANMHFAVEFKPTFEKVGLVNKVVTWNKIPANLTCIAHAIPNATISWYHGNTQISRNSDKIYTIFGTGWHSILQVTPLESTYYGPYKCKAVNVHGDDSYEIRLEEAFPPGAPEGVTVNNTAATSVTFRFHDPQYSNNLPVKGYVVQYVKENEDFSNAKTMQWPFGEQRTLENLDPSTRYQFRFAVINDAGTGPWGSHLSVVTPNISPPSEPLISNPKSDGQKWIKSPYAHKIEVRWNIPSNNGIPIDKYAITYCVTPENEQEFDDQKRCTTNEIGFSSVLSSYVIENLNPDTIYSVQVSAHNSIGFGAASKAYFKTNVTTETSIEMQPNGLSSAVIIWVVVAVLIALLVIIDIFCFFVSETGVLYMIFGSCCGKKKKNDDKLGSESKDLISNGHKKIDIEEQSPMIADGTKKDTSVEYDLKKGVAKTGFVGKDSAV